MWGITVYKFWLHCLPELKMSQVTFVFYDDTLQRSNNERNGISNHQPDDCLPTQPFIETQIKENIKAPRHWPLWGEFTGDRWIPRIKGQ